MKTTNVDIMDINMKTSISKQRFGVQSTEKKILGNRYGPKVALKDKVYPKTYYKHQLRNVTVDETPTKIKARELQIAKWMLIEDQ